MSFMIKVQVGEYRSISCFEIEEKVEFCRGDYVILDIDRGSEFGRVVSHEKIPIQKKSVKGRVLRVATAGDLKQIENNRMKAKDAMNTCVRKVNDRGLDMRMVKVEYTFDSSKVIFFFTSDGRVDFRNLVKDLARIFRVRIELKQIGVRDKAKIVDGHGVCGRQLCCCGYMHEFYPLSIKMAKVQGLPLNPSRISGVCGRIKCCMYYEAGVYRELSRGLPKIGDRIDLPEGKGRVVDMNILKRTVVFDLGEGKIIKRAYPKLDFDKRQETLDDLHDGVDEDLRDEE